MDIVEKSIKIQEQRNKKKLERSVTARGVDIEIDFWRKFLDSGLFDSVYALIAIKIILDIFYSLKSIKENGLLESSSNQTAEQK